MVIDITIPPPFFSMSSWAFCPAKSPASQLKITCLKSTIEALEKDVKYVQS